jgi:hypothetical protein
MRILVVGDTHGMSGVVEAKAKIASRLDCEVMLVVGDFGVWPGTGGIAFLDDVNAAARANDIKVYALPGNHEDHDQWEWWLSSSMPKDDYGFTYVRSNLLLSPKVHNWKWDKKRFFICGGAVSIDRQWRTEGKSYWRNETFSEDDLSSVEKYRGPAVDYLFTHDCSNYTPWGFSLVPDPDSQENRHRIDKAIRALKPRQHFHGHMHHRYDWDNPYNEAEYPTRTYGLDCNGEANSWGVLDTEKDRFFWPSAAVARYDPAFK